MKLLYRIIFVIGFLTLLYFVIAYARGYRIDFNKKSLSPTGILAISSYPNAAKIYVNGSLKGVTDTNLTLPPGNYQIEIKKEGYTSWSKKISLKGELVLTLEPVLFPLNPTLSPLTNLGIIKTIPIDDTEKIILLVQKNPEDEENKNGIYIFDAGGRPLSFFPPLKTVILKKNLPETVDFAITNVTISPDTKEAIFEFGDKKTKTAYLLSLEEQNQTPFDVTLSEETLLDAWGKQKQNDNIKVLETFPDDFAKIASQSVTIVSFSPNDTKILYQANENFTIPLIIDPPLIATNQTIEQRTLKKGNLYVYDKKEDKNYEISKLKSQISNLPIQWYFDSKHLLINEDKKIVVLDYDGENQQTVYSGPYEPPFFVTTSDGKIIILANLNPQANLFPDLYLVGTR